MYEGIAASLERATGSVHALNSLLDKSSRSLYSKISDADRVAVVADNRKCYELVTESEVRSAQFQLTSEIEPQISELLQHAEGALLRLQKREAALREQSAPAIPNPDLEGVHAACVREKRALEEEISRLDADLADRRAALRRLEDAS